ncbi:pre-mRNA-splicing factor CWC25 homolog [Neodiprion pinetum]|uniref:pre-mRNA-splicing factor CWC25 homolog n=1 Tax=Neodiprion pinetum TaxID=441929 RepID=UPI001EDD8FCC|nr:pre-mRNA-splicing factor CWC25 homolog [Neodiprion pinetum]XP_046468894.1 pre-mRNA-splicing factor CWC25 homolog [Neodiprion pinetum]
MGGGDLNLKKSWHPSTMKNMEKVWKAEQQNSQEKKRIAELKREIEMEKDREDMTKYAMDQGVIEKKEDKKLDWMYQGPNQMLNREDYLLGRAIDKPFEQMAQAEKEAEQNRAPKNHVEYECIPPSLRFFSGNEQVDLARKLQEDPLYAIKKKEMESRSQLLKNPVKLKQLKQLLEEQATKSRAEKKHKKRKSKKQSKHDSEGSDSDKDLDNLLAAKYNKLKNKINEKDLLISVKKLQKQKKKKESKKSSDSQETSEDEEMERKTNSKDKSWKKQPSIDENEFKKRSHKSRVTSYDTERGHERVDRRRYKNNSYSHEEDASGSKDKHKRTGSVNDTEGFQKNRHQTKRRRNSNDFGRKSSKSLRSETKRLHSPEYSSNDEEEHHMKSRGNYGLIRSDGTKIVPSGTSNHLDTVKPHEKKMAEKRWVPPKREKLTEDEKERRRQEMMVNASWRDKEREQNVKRYRDEEKREISDKTYNKEFIRKQLAVAAEVGTVESRIKANMNNIQRSRRAMDTNFAKR